MPQFVDDWRYLKIIYWVRFQFGCISFVSSSHQHRVRPCLASLILDPSISNNNLVRLILIKLLIKIINFRFLITDPNNAQICSTMPYIELRAGRELFDIVSSIDNIGLFFVM
jgi:hypothetical protein